MNRGSTGYGYSVAPERSPKLGWLGWTGVVIGLLVCVALFVLFAVLAGTKATLFE